MANTTKCGFLWKIGAVVASFFAIIATIVCTILMIERRTDEKKTVKITDVIDIDKNPSQTEKMDKAEIKKLSETLSDINSVIKKN